MEQIIETNGQAPTPLTLEEAEKLFELNVPVTEDAAEPTEAEKVLN